MELVGQGSVEEKVLEDDELGRRVFHPDWAREGHVGEGFDDGGVLRGGVGTLEGVDFEAEGVLGVEGPVGGAALADILVEGGVVQAGAPEFVDC